MQEESDLRIWVLMDFVFNFFSDFGAQMVAGFKKFEEIGAFVSSRSGFGLWDFWDLDEIPWARWDCG